MPITYPLIAVNGVIDAPVSPLDRGFAYGDGLFETCRITSGIVPLWSLHKARLLAGCERLRIELSLELLERWREQLMAASDLADGLLKVTVTRGVGGRGYAIPDTAEPTVCIGIYPFSPRTGCEHGVALAVCELRLGVNPVLAGIKHLNKLEHVLARSEWNDVELVDGILLDVHDRVIETTSSNLFIVKNGKLLTPDLSECGVEGVMRRLIIETLAPSSGLAVSVTDISIDDVLAADEVFMCNSVNGIWPVTQIRHTTIKLFDVGSITLTLQRALASFLEQCS